MILQRHQFLISADFQRFQRRMKAILKLRLTTNHCLPPPGRTLLIFLISGGPAVNWLHRGAVYDVGLYLIGIPFSLWAVARVSGVLSKYPSLPTIIEAAIYVYVFFIGLNLFRLFFGYSRWVFPKIELSPKDHRRCVIEGFGLRYSCGIWKYRFGDFAQDILSPPERTRLRRRYLPGDLNARVASHSLQSRRPPEDDNILLVGTCTTSFIGQIASMYNVGAATISRLAA